MLSVIIVAAGRSTRMAHLPPGVEGALSVAPDKLFLPLAGRPVLAHCLSRIQTCAEVDEVIIVTRAERLNDVRALVEKNRISKVTAILEGGKERQDSVWNGLQSLNPKTELVAVHDGARPFFPALLMPRLIAVARQHGSAVVCTKVTDTIKEISPDSNPSHSLSVLRTVDRSKLRAVQTPQVFQAELLKRAYAYVRDKKKLVTDEAAAVESFNAPVQLVECPDPNPKITTPSDLSYAELLLKM